MPPFSMFSFYICGRSVRGCSNQFFPFFHLLKVVSGILGIIIMGLVGALIFFWPILDQYIFQKIDRSFKCRLEVSWLAGVVFIGIYLAWAYLEAIY